MRTNTISICAKAVRFALLVGTACTFESVAETEQEEIEVIEVRGIRASLNESVNTKRMSNAVVDAITAEDIGKFPDKNVADSLQRITGVSISRDFGEGEKVSIRGTAPGLNRTLLNGQNVATADWFILDKPSRSFNYSLLPSEIVSSLEVHKSPQADIDEGSIGGTVIVRTRRPLAMPSSRLAGTVEGTYNDLSDAWDPSLSVLYSWKNPDENFGVLVSLIKQDRTLRRDGFEVLGWDKRTIAGQENISVPSLIGSAYFQQERERESGVLTFQYAPNDVLDMTLNLLHSKMDANNLNHNYLVPPTWEWDSGRTPNGPNVESPVIQHGTLVSATMGASDRRGAVHNVANRISFTETSAYDLDINYLGDLLTWHGQIGYTKAEGGTTRDIFSEFAANTKYSFDLRQGVPQVSFPTSFDSTDPALLNNLDWAHMNSRPTEDEEWYAQLDISREVNAGIFHEVKLGMKYRDHDKNLDFQAGRFHVPTDGFSESILDEVKKNNPSMANFADGLIPSDFMSDLRLPGSLVSYPKLNADKLAEALTADPNRIVFYRFLPEIFAINEKISAGYAKGSFEGENFRGNIGLRLVQTELTSSSWQWNGPWHAPTSKTWKTFRNRYSDVLPSFNLNYDLQDDLQLRVAAARVMARPEYSKLAASTSLINSNLTGTSGNPELEPFRANQIEVGVEWYFMDSALLSATVFAKDIESYVIDTQSSVSMFDELTGSNKTFQISRPINGDGGTNKGLELSYQQPFFDSFGVIANYTYSNAKADNRQQSGSDKIPGNSKNTVNLSAYYEDDALSGRLSYNYRSSYLEGIERGAELMTDSRGQWDASFSYNINEQISVSLKGVNLTDEEIFKYSETKSRPTTYYLNGRRYYAGVHVQF
ncbi:TonB-dependent receptor [Algicola sagamiensis]|uniref:TonB-dependent receptor n=1 Tax=Algicola sagamiensis TaxID=163869 RepID=UPI000378CFC5|nr:TonB-dependent receptor [Algicola sagamiensis]